MRAGNPGVPTASEWVADVLAPGGRVGIDPVSYYQTFETVSPFFRSISSGIQSRLLQYAKALCWTWVVFG